MPTRSWAIAPHATLRWVRADLRARRFQAILTVAVVAGVVAALLLAAMLLEGTTNPWQGLFARTHAEGQAILLVTHDARVASNADRVINLYDGMVADDWSFG